MKVSGNLDHANQDHIAFAAGILGTELIIENWSKITNKDQLVVLFTQYIVAVMRGFANVLESRKVQFVGSTQEGLLILSFRTDEEPSPNDPMPFSEDAPENGDSEKPK